MTALDVLIYILRGLLVVLVVLQIVPLLIWLERKGSAYIQDRPGPERAHVGPLRLAGLFHVLADAIKLFSKEDFMPAGANKFFYYLAPMIPVGIALITVAVVPFWHTMVFPNGYTVIGQVLAIDPGILWFFAIVSLTVYGVIFAGWSSNSKFSLLGAMRASAASLSYEIPMVLAAISAIMTYGSVNLAHIADAQTGVWWGFLPRWGVFVQPLAALIFLVTSFAETNRVPFDLAEAESELVAGYHTEYSSMKWGMFMFAEYAAMIVSTAVFTTLWFGGYNVPWLDTAALIAHAQYWTEWLLGITFVVGLVGFAVNLNHFAAGVGRWRDIRDYEGLVLAMGAIGTAAVALLLLFLCFAFHLPDWYGPLFAGFIQLQMFIVKVLFFCWVFVWVRWTLPRFRYDQLMNLGWKSLLPLALANILLTGILITVLK
ncbi:MAG TPA: complex I subunit 1 family protein [Oscillatoriaceae cyanobacterium]